MNDQKKSKNVLEWIKKLGIFGFLFFFIKGLAWLVVLYLGAKIL